MRVVKGQDDVKVGDLVEFRRVRAGRTSDQQCGGVVVSVRDASVTVSHGEGYNGRKYKSIVRYSSVIEVVKTAPPAPPRESWLAKRPTCIRGKSLIATIEIGKMPSANRADAFAAIAREVEAWLREEPAP